MESLVEFFQKVLVKAVQVKASDIHLCVGSPWKYRLDGHITPLKTKPLEAGECEELVRHILSRTNFYSPEDIEKVIATARDIDCSYSIPGVSRFRVNICRQRGSFSVVLRVVSFAIPNIEQLGLPNVIRDIALEERGLILVTGITGSGKSTTLAAMINLINQTKPCKIITIEDPIEYIHKENKSSIIQREVGSDTESFAVALRAALRQDPDIILVGEMRDTITIETALKAAETGHLVLSTLHTMDASKTIQRIISAFDLSEQQTIRLRLADALKAAISQRLLRKKDGSGRVAVLEIMRNTLAIKDCIENPDKTGSIVDFMQTGGDSYGMQTFDQHLMALYKANIIDMATAKAAATSPADFERNVIFA
jgi:twitching motility protein PilT